MSLIHWKEEFSVGVAEVDHEHQELIELINVLHRSVQEGVTRRQVIEGLGPMPRTRKIMRRCSTTCATSWMRSRTTAISMSADCQLTSTAGLAIIFALMMRNCIATKDHTKNVI
jgi:hypothetical protein